MGANRLQDRHACISLKATDDGSIKGITPTVTRKNSNVVWCIPDLERFKWQEFYLDYRDEKKGPKRTLAWPPKQHTLLWEHFAASSLELRLDVPESAQVGVSHFPARAWTSRQERQVHNHSETPLLSTSGRQLAVPTIRRFGLGYPGPCSQRLNAELRNRGCYLWAHWCGLNRRDSRRPPVPTRLACLVRHGQDSHRVPR